MKVDYKVKEIGEIEILFQQIARVVPPNLEVQRKRDLFGWGQTRLDFMEYAKVNMRFLGEERPTVEEACVHPYMKEVIGRWQDDPVTAALRLQQMIADYKQHDLPEGEQAEF